MDADLPTIEAMRAYAADTRYGITCREVHLSWAIGLAIERGRTDLVSAYCEIRRSMRATCRPT